MTKAEKIELLSLLEQKERNKLERRLFSYYPDEGPLRRELYVKHCEFFKAGPKHRERLMLAANRVGKTEGVGGYEMALHLTGLYPDWWTGVRYKHAINAWAAGDTGKTVRDIVQNKLLGPHHDQGTGLIPKEQIVGRPTSKPGVPQAVETIQVRHVSGDISTITLKSYDQKREAFQGTKIDVIWLDEEPPQDIYTECLLRTMKTGNEAGGMLMLTFTPLRGMSDVVLSFLPSGELAENKAGKKFVVMATWDDAPHLSKEEKDQLWEAMPPHQRDARSKGIPQLGSGAIYPVPETDILITDFEIPDHWPRFYGMDVGWNRTAVAWFAWDRESDVIYLTSEHYRGQAEPSIHAQAVRARGSWIRGVIDPAARGRSQGDGGQLLQDYIDLGLDLEVAFNGVESGIYEVWQRLSSGRLKIFRSCQNWINEFRLYRRDDKGRVVKDNDHIMDATRYGIMSGLERSTTKPLEKKQQVVEYIAGHNSGGWMS